MLVSSVHQNGQMIHPIVMHFVEVLIIGELMSHGTHAIKFHRLVKMVTTNGELHQEAETVDVLVVLIIYVGV